MKDGSGGSRRLPIGSFEAAVVLGVGREQALDLAVNLRVAGAGRRSEAEPLLRLSHRRLRRLRGEDALATRQAAERLAALR